MVRQHHGAGGYRSGRIGEFTFTMDTPVNRIVVLVECDVYLFTARVKTHKH